MRQPDNWGWKARIGMFIVGVEAVPEAEWWAMMPPGVSVHAARISASTPWAKWSADGQTVEFKDDLALGTAQFAAMHLSAVVIGHSSSSIAGGKGWDAAVVERLSQSGPAGRAATTNGLDCQAALRASKMKSRFSSSPHGSTRGHTPRAPTISPITCLSHQAICGSTRAEIGGTCRPAISMRKAWASTRTWSPSTGKSAAPAHPRPTAS